MPKFVCVYSDSSRIPLGTVVEASYLLTNPERFQLSMPIVHDGDTVHEIEDTMPVYGNLWRWEEFKE